MERKHLIGLSSKDYEHPSDKTALDTLRGTPGLEKAMSTFMNWTAVRWDIVAHKGSNFHVTETSCPELYNLVDEAARILDVKDFPKVYIEWGMYINGHTWGYKDTTMMVLNSGVPDLMTPMEQTFVIGHELGHVKSRHVIYYNLARHIAAILPQIPFISDMIQPALLYWSRMSEFTADRAGLLACQDLNAAITAMVKMSGIPYKYFDKINIDDFLREAQTFESELSGVEAAMRTLANMYGNDHPWTLLRALELKRWVDSGEYDAIISGNAGKKCSVCGKFSHKDATECEYCGSEF